MAYRQETTQTRARPAIGRASQWAAEEDARQLPGQQLRDQQVKVTVSATHWRPWGELDLAEWTVLGRRLGSIGRGVAWWIGDWVNYGNTAFGEKYSRAARITGYDVQSLMNMSYVASRFDGPRRREDLSWSHHAELAALPVEYQEMWLESAQRDRISVRGLRESVRTWRNSQPGARPAAESDDRPLRSPLAQANRDPAPKPQQAADEVVCPQCGYHMTAAAERG